jgi:hypothetical protein
MPVIVKRPPLLCRARPVKARSDIVESVLRTRSIRTRLTELLKALVTYIKQLLKKCKCERARPVPILRTDQLILTPPRRLSSLSHTPDRTLPRDEVSPLVSSLASKTLTPSPQCHSVAPALPIRNAAQLNMWCSPTPAGPLDAQKTERMWIAWKERMQRGVDEYDGMILPHNGEWSRRYGAGWIKVCGQ